MTDVEYCAAFAMARRLRDDAMVPLLHRVATREGSKIHWGVVTSDPDILTGNNGCFRAWLESDSLGGPAFRISAEVTIAEDRPALRLSVKCEHTNALSGRVKSEGLRSAENKPLSMNFDPLRDWFSGEFEASVERAAHRLAERGNR